MPNDTARADQASAAIEFVNALTGETLIGADAILDEIRRAFWWLSFSGAALQATCDELAVSAKARALLPQLEGLSIAEFDFFIAQVRTFLWTQTFAGIPESRFARVSAPPPQPGDTRVH